MNFIYLVVLLNGVLCIDDMFAIPGFDLYFTIQGQVIFSSKSRVSMSIPPKSQLIIELHDISVTHDLVTTIARDTLPAVVFPIIFNLRYSFYQIVRSHVHVLNAKIINNNNEILFANHNRIQVKLLGMGRTTFIDVPVVCYTIEHDYSTRSIKLLEWPELLGVDGDKAVETIKQQTGYEHVFIVKDESQISKDLRYDRVCVYVNEDNKVVQIPKTG